MKRSIIMAAIKIGVEIVVLSIIVGIAVVVIGNWRQWETSQQYSNAFFVAGCLVIIGGTSSRMGASQEWDSFRRVSGEGFGDMSPSERANFIVEASSSLRLVIIGIVSGILLILISLLVWYSF